MNKDNAKDYLPLVQALAEGKMIQSNHAGRWVDLISPTFCDPITLYRIKPEPKKAWYRVALCKTNLLYTNTIDSVLGENEASFEGEDFVRWLTDRIEYELPEGEV